MAEVEIMRKIQIAMSTVGARVFRNNVGLGWIGRSKKFTKTETITVHAGDVLIREARPLHAGLVEGSGDLIGWTEKGKFLSVEVKTESGRLSPEQRAFKDTVNAAGGLAIVARSTEEAINGLSNG